jgi:hypothetical protein
MERKRGDVSLEKKSRFLSFRRKRPKKISDGLKEGTGLNL